MNGAVNGEVSTDDAKLKQQVDLMAQHDLEQEAAKWTFNTPREGRLFSSGFNAGVASGIRIYRAFLKGQIANKAVIPNKPNE